MNIRHTIASNRKSPNESVEYRGPRIAIGVVASLSRVRLLAASRSLLLTTPLDGGGEVVRRRMVLSVQTGRGVHPVRMGCPPLSIPGPKFSRPRRVNKRLSISHLYIYIYIYIYIYLCVRAQRGPSLQTSLFRDAHPLAREREGDAGISANTGEHVRVRGIGNTSRDAARLPARASFEPLSKKTGLVYSVPGTFERARASSLSGAPDE